MKATRYDQIIRGYIRAIQKARSNMVEEGRGSMEAAAIMDPNLFSDEAETLLKLLAVVHDDTPDAMTTMNMSVMVANLAERSCALRICAVTQIKPEYNFLDNPVALL